MIPRLLVGSLALLTACGSSVAPVAAVSDAGDVAPPPSDVAAPVEQDAYAADVDASIPPLDTRASEEAAFEAMMIECNFATIPPTEKTKFDPIYDGDVSAGHFFLHLGFNTCCADFEYTITCPDGDTGTFRPAGDNTAPPPACSEGRVGAGDCQMAWNCDHDTENEVVFCFRDPATGVHGCKTFMYVTYWAEHSHPIGLCEDYWKP